MGKGRRTGEKTNNKKGIKVLIIFLIILIIIAGILFALKVLNKGQVETNTDAKKSEEKVKDEPQVKIVNVN